MEYLGLRADLGQARRIGRFVDCSLILLESVAELVDLSASFNDRRYVRISIASFRVVDVMPFCNMAQTNTSPLRPRPRSPLAASSDRAAVAVPLVSRLLRHQRPTAWQDTMW